MEWISVKDRLPDEEDVYIVYYHVDGKSLVGTLVYFIYENGTQRWGLRNIDIKKGFEVTHWMPMPKPPKDET